MFHHFSVVTPPWRLGHVPPSRLRRRAGVWGHVRLAWMVVPDPHPEDFDPAMIPSPEHRRRCPECRGRKLLPGMVRTEGKGMGSAYGPCPTCDGVGYVTDEVEE